MGLFTFLNTREIKAQNDELLTGLKAVGKEMGELSRRLARLESEVERLKDSGGAKEEATNGGD